MEVKNILPSILVVRKKKIRIASAAKKAIKITNFEYSELFFIYIFELEMYPGSKYVMSCLYYSCLRGKDIIYIFCRF